MIELPLKSEPLNGTLKYFDGITCKKIFIPPDRYLGVGDLTILYRDQS